MNEIEKLIQELCPDGVEYRRLGEIGTFYGGLSGKSKKDFEDGNAKFITYLNVYSNPSLDFNIKERVKILEGEKQNTVQKGDILFTGSSETPDECGMSSVVTKDVTEDFYLNSFCFGFRLDVPEMFNYDFLKHYFRTHSARNQIAKTASGVTRFNVSKAKFAKVEIPLPPITIQEKIVEILDKFTSLEVELEQQLEAELEARRKQYEYYREKLLDLEGKEGVEMKTLGEVCEVTDYVASGSFASLRDNVHYYQEPNYAVLVRTVDLSQNFEGDKIYIDEKAYNFLSKSNLFGGEIIINNIGAGVGKTFKCPYRKEKMSLAPNAILVKTPNNDFYYHWFNSKFGQNAMKKIITPGALPKFNKTGFKSLSIPLPPLSEQRRIVAILDRFEALTNDLQAGLPAEIAARRQQYEYYREKLLTFKRKTV